MIEIILSIAIIIGIVVGYGSLSYAIITVPIEIKRIADQLEHINSARK